MTENLLQKLEEKMMLLVAEIEQARKEIERLSKENINLKTEKEKNANKLNELLSLLDALDIDNELLINESNVGTVRPVVLTN